MAKNRTEGHIFETLWPIGTKFGVSHRHHVLMVLEQFRFSATYWKFLISHEPKISTFAMSKQIYLEESNLIFQI